jgi:hypothetical protein
MQRVVGVHVLEGPQQPNHEEEEMERHVELDVQDKGKSVGSIVSRVTRRLSIRVFVAWLRWE